VRKVEGIEEAQLRKLPGSGNGGQHVATLNGLLKIPYGRPCEVMVAPSPGAETVSLSLCAPSPR